MRDDEVVRKAAQREADRIIAEARNYRRGGKTNRVNADVNRLSDQVNRRIRYRLKTGKK